MKAIEQAFEQAIFQRGLSKKVKSFTKFQIYHFRSGKTKPTLGDKILLLHDLGMLKIILNEPNSQS
jgi:hypothetical protein